VTLREGAALAVLADRRTGNLVEQRREGQVLAHRPVDAGARLHHLAAALQQALDRLVSVEVLRMAVMRGPPPSACPWRRPCCRARLVVGEADSAQRPSSQSALLGGSCRRL